MGHRLQLDHPLQRALHPALGLQHGRIPSEDGAFDPGVFPDGRRVSGTSLGTSDVGPVAKHRFGPLQGPVLARDGHHLDRAAVLA